MTWDEKVAFADGQGRWVRHRASGFTVDVIRVAGPPSAFLWAATPPKSDKGEAHCGEHVLLGKGAQGRRVASAQGLLGAQSSAQTHPLRTAYHCHVPTSEAGPLMRLLDLQIDALLHPDCSDEEIRREVFSVSADDAGELLETGAVYNEMVAAYEGPSNRCFRVVRELLFGPDHPLTFESGGAPEALREFTAADFRAFHAEAYRLHRMGVVLSLPPEADEAAALAALDAALARHAPHAAFDARVDPLELPLPAYATHAPDDAVRHVPYPCETEASETSFVVLAFPPTRGSLLLDDPAEDVLLHLFESAVAGAAGSELHRAFVDSEHREVDFPCTSTHVWHDAYPGSPLFVSVDGLPRAALEAHAGAVRDKALEVLRRVAEWRAGDERLARFNERVAAALVAWKRHAARFADVPTGFGVRGTHDEWLEHLRELHRKMSPPLDGSDDLARAEALLPGTWGSLLRKWRLLEDRPFVVTALPSSALHADLERERKARLAAAAASFDVAAHRRVTAELEAAARADAAPPDVGPVQRPLSADEGLEAEVQALYAAARPGRVDGTLTVARAGPGASVCALGLALRLPAADPHVLQALTLLCSGVGLADLGGRGALGHAEARSARQRELYCASVGVVSDAPSGRVELSARCVAASPAELPHAEAWLEALLSAPLWTEANLPRLRDVVDQAIDGYMAALDGRAEFWASGVFSAVLWQDRRGGVGSTFDAMLQSCRVAWLLAEDRDRDGARDVQRLVAHTPHARTAARDARELTALMREDLARPPGELLAAMRALLRSARAAPGRGYALARPGLLERVAGAVRGVAGRLLDLDLDFDLGEGEEDDDPPGAGVHESPALQRRHAEAMARPAPARRPVDRRAQQHHPCADPAATALVHEASEKAVLQLGIPAPPLFDTSREALLDHLAVKQVSGGGGHSLFMRVWQAGLAYSNGASSSASASTATFYADHCGSAVETLAFVRRAVAEGLGAHADYAVAQVCAPSNLTLPYEDRVHAHAGALVSGHTREAVRAFRRAVLALSVSDAELEARARRRFDDMLAPRPASQRTHRKHETILVGNAEQADAFEEALGLPVQRVYPRDFWDEGTAEEARRALHKRRSRARVGSLVLLGVLGMSAASVWP